VAPVGPNTGGRGNLSLSRQDPFELELPLQRRWKPELDHLDVGVLRAIAYRSTFSLLQAHRGPRKIVVDHPSCPLEIESLGSDVGDDEMLGGDAGVDWTPKPAEDGIACQKSMPDAGPLSGTPCQPQMSQAIPQISDRVTECCEHESWRVFLQQMFQPVQLSVWLLDCRGKVSCLSLQLGQVA
jgi:hypothetical protein